MTTEKPSVLLVLEIHCAITTPPERLGHASIWIAPPEPYVGPVRDTLAEQGMIKIYGPAPMRDAEEFQQRLSDLLSHTGCAVAYETAADD